MMLARFVAVTLVVVFHEFAHAFAAYKCGDPTAKFEGRMTLNPAKHFDLLGIFAFVFIGFGWAKPVPVNPNNFKDYRKGSLWTASAGIITNYLMAVVLYPLLLVVLYFVLPLFQGLYGGIFLKNIFYYCYAYSLTFALFNFLPFFPLDGFRIVDALDAKRGKTYWFLRQYGYYILLGLMLVSMVARYIPVFGYFDVLSYLSRFAIYGLGKPITLLWDWIFSFFV